MKLNEYRQIARNEWENTVHVRDNVSLGTFIVMPKNIHGIIQIDFSKKIHEVNLQKAELLSGESKLIESKLIESQWGESQFATTKDLSKSIFQRNYYEIIIRDDRDYNNIMN